MTIAIEFKKIDKAQLTKEYHPNKFSPTCYYIFPQEKSMKTSPTCSSENYPHHMKKNWRQEEKSQISPQMKRKILTNCQVEFSQKEKPSSSQ